MPGRPSRTSFLSSSFPIAFIVNSSSISGFRLSALFLECSFRGPLDGNPLRRGLVLRDGRQVSVQSFQDCAATQYLFHQLGSCLDHVVVLTCNMISWSLDAGDVLLLHVNQEFSDSAEAVPWKSFFHRWYLPDGEDPSGGTASTEGAVSPETCGQLLLLTENDMGESCEWVLKTSSCDSTLREALEGPGRKSSFQVRDAVEHASRSSL